MRWNGERLLRDVAVVGQLCNERAGGQTIVETWR
jgi:hypothetical protein